MIGCEMVMRSNAQLLAADFVRTVEITAPVVHWMLKVSFSAFERAHRVPISFSILTQNSAYTDKRGQIYFSHSCYKINLSPFCFFVVVVCSMR